MTTVTIHVAKTNLSQLLARVEAGEEIVIARGRNPIARLTPIRRAPTARKFGALKGVVTVPRSADEDRVMEVATDAGAEDMTQDGDRFVVTSAPNDLSALRGADGGR